ncbi:hypothetical protein ACQPYK_29745 [Streptosporangium sp. CA-135522]|uniref:hypothetical protein n=1 Tax=Streptosporangium sp. CA-135522 TaxID=3240072 RepID=UPI003D8C3AD3
MLELMHILKAYQEIEQYDFIHDHSDAIGLALRAISSRLEPVIQTMHAPPTSKWYGPVHETVQSQLDLVVISAAQMNSAPHLRFVDMIHHGIQTDRFTFQQDK